MHLEEVLTVQFRTPIAFRESSSCAFESLKLPFRVGEAILLDEVDGRASKERRILITGESWLVDGSDLKEAVDVEEVFKALEDILSTRCFFLNRLLHSSLQY